MLEKKKKKSLMALFRYGSLWTLKHLSSLSREFFNRMLEIAKPDPPADRRIEVGSCFSLRIKGLANVTRVNYSVVVFADLGAAFHG